MDRRQPEKRSPLVPTGIALFVLAVLASGPGTIALMTSAFEDPEVFAVGSARVLPTTPGERFMVWVEKSAPDSPVCTASDVTSGQQLPIEPVLRHQHEGRRSVARFEAMSAQTELTCTGRRQIAYLTTAYDERWMAERLVPVFAPYVGFGVAGAVCLSLGLRRARRARG